jgi:ribonuclease H2 subunit B
MCYKFTQTDGSPGTYRPADDIFEEAAENLKNNSGETEGTYSNDVMRFSSLDCVKKALKRICEEKGVYFNIISRNVHG